MPQPNEGPGASPVGTMGVLVMFSYLAVLAVVLTYVLVAAWPQPVPSLGSPDQGREVAQAFWSCSPEMVNRWARDTTVVDPKCVTLAGRGFLLSDEQRLFLLVIVAGALGALLHALRSLSMYIGNRELKRSWIAMYAALPASGGILAMVFYVVLRGGFVTTPAEVSATSPFAFIAVALLVGLFSQIAIEKLKQVAESVFTKVPQSGDALSEKEEVPLLLRAQRVASTPGGPEDAIEVEGTGFSEATRLEVNGRERQPELRGPTRVRLILDPTELAVLDNGGELTVQVKNGEKKSEAIATVS